MAYFLPPPVFGHVCVHFEPYRSAAYKAEFTLPGCCIDNDLHCGLACSVPGHVSCPRSFFFLFLFMPCVGAPGACWSPYSTWLTVGCMGTRKGAFHIGSLLAANVPPLLPHQSIAARIWGRYFFGSWTCHMPAMGLFEFPPATADLTRLTKACDFMAQLLPHAVTS